MTLERVLILSAVIFSIGLYGFLTKRYNDADGNRANV